MKAQPRSSNNDTKKSESLRSYPSYVLHSSSSSSQLFEKSYTKKTDCSSRSTDAKASKTPVVDDVVLPSNTSSGEQRVNKRNAREESFPRLSRLKNKEK